jgi:Mrp family chromosome partitioning ATPase
MIEVSKTAAKFPLYGADPETAAGKVYAQIVDQLLELEDSSQRVLVTSPGVGEGKSVTAVNLAYAFHARGISVLLAEFAFQRPVFAEIFGPSPIPFGVEDALALGTSLDSVVCERLDGLRIAMASGSRPEGGELGPGPALERTLHEARTSYDWTILDGPSVADLEDPAAVAAAVGITLMVTRAGETESKSLLKALARVQPSKTFVMLNDATPTDAKGLPKPGALAR